MTQITDEQESETTIEVVSFMSRMESCMHHEDGSQLADVTAGDTFTGIRLLLLICKKPGYTCSRWETVVLNNNQITNRIVWKIA